MIRVLVRETPLDSAMHSPFGMQKAKATPKPTTRSVPAASLHSTTASESGSPWNLIVVIQGFISARTLNTTVAPCGGAGTNQRTSSSPSYCMCTKMSKSIPDGRTAKRLATRVYRTANRMILSVLRTRDVRQPDRSFFFLECRLPRSPAIGHRFGRIQWLSVAVRDREPAHGVQAEM